jgi:hypothetical protein
MHSRYIVLALVFVVFPGAVPVGAHHSIAAEFQRDKEFTVTGVLTQIDWVNPHIATWVMVKNERTGALEKVGCQGNPPNTYSRAGLKKSDWKIGETVTITCLQAKSGAKDWGLMKQMRYQADGRVMVFRDPNEDR